MPDTVAVLFFLLLLVAGLFLEPLAARWRIPVSVPLVLLGFGASEFATRLLGLDLGIRWNNLGTLITFVIVPILVFESALRLDTGALRREWLPVLLLAVPLLVLAACMVALLTCVWMDNPRGFPWIAALLAGAILGCTEMTGMFRLLVESGASTRVAWILEGESIFNDTAALVLFMLVLAVATMHAEDVTATGVGLLFLRLAAGGIAVGCTWGWVARWVWRQLPGAQTFALLSMATAWGVFLLAQQVLEVSGAMAVLCAGLVLCADARRDPARVGFAAGFWQFAVRTAGALVFILAGATITPGMFADQWLTMLIGAGAVLLARCMVVFGVLGPACRPCARPLAWEDLSLLTWGAVRGSVTLALALSLPLQLDYWYTLQSLVYGAVLFSLFVQAPTVSRIAGRK